MGKGELGDKRNTGRRAMQKGRVATLDIDEGAGRRRLEAEPSETRRFLRTATLVPIRLVTCDTVTISVPGTKMPAGST
jgi:hypothetical protein